MRADSSPARVTPPADQFDLAVEMFGMLADTTRLRLLWALLDREMSVNELAEAIRKPPAGVSQHLAKLRMARVVRTRRQGNQIFYRLDDSHVRQMVEDAIYQAEHASGGQLAHHVGDPGVHRLAADAETAT